LLSSYRSNIMRIILTGGGTGGHIFPLVSVAKKLKEKLGANAELLYIGSGAKIEKEVMEKEGIATKNIVSGKMRRYFSLQNFVDLFRIPVGIIQSLWILVNFMPDVVFSKGGYACVPIVIAAWIYRIPVLIHESDAIAGLANRFSGKLAKRVAISYPSAKKYFSPNKIAMTGNPVRKELVGADSLLIRNNFSLIESRPIILVLGGSQGSQVINDSIIKILPQLLKRAQIIHQTGELNYENVIHKAAEYGIKSGRDGYIPVKFLEPKLLGSAYAASDLIISRAGANSIAEIAANRKPAIFIPLSNSANDHQRGNAYDIAEIGGALVLEESNLGSNIFLERIEKMLNEKEFSNSMVEKIVTFYHPNADEIIANGILEIV